MKKYIIFLVVLYFIVINIDANELNSKIKFRKTEVEHSTMALGIGIAVNSLEDIAIGFDDDHINVYDKNGKFKYSYTFEVDGTYFFEFDGQDNMMIFTVRGDKAYLFDRKSELIKVNRIIDSVEKNEYYKTHSNKKRIDVNGNTYILKQPLGYTQLIKINENGHSQIIYNIGFNYIGKILLVTLVGIILGIAIFAIVKNINKEIKRYNKYQEVRGGIRKYETSSTHKQCIQILSMRNMYDIFMYEYNDLESTITFISIATDNHPNAKATYKLNFEEGEKTVITMQLIKESIIGAAIRYEGKINEFMAKKLDAWYIT